MSIGNRPYLNFRDEEAAKMSIGNRPYLNFRDEEEHRSHGMSRP